jgi:tetratricopeptide (TPR) repeat protein
MTGKLHLPAIAALLVLTGETRAQLIAPYPYAGGVGFQFSSGRFRVGGFLQGSSYYAPLPYGVIERQIIVQPIVQAPVQRAAAAPRYDLSGIDLDVETPDKLYPPGKAPLPMPAPVEHKPPAKGPEKLPAPKPEMPPPPPVDPLLEPRAVPAEESRRLAELGIRAFRAGEYGLALRRFREATDIDRTNARAFFLLGQASVAVGQYHDAVTAIQDGLHLQPDWPTSDFRPRVELYGDDPDAWRELGRRLDDALRRKPDDPACLFLRAYLLWFDGQRAAAAEWFVRARARTADPRWIDLFLRHASPPAVAASR